LPRKLLEYWNRWHPPRSELVYPQIGPQWNRCADTVGGVIGLCMGRPRRRRPPRNETGGGCQICAVLLPEASPESNLRLSVGHSSTLFPPAPAGMGRRHHRYVRMSISVETAAFFHSKMG
jgi:hypothetical protein